MAYEWSEEPTTSVSIRVSTLEEFMIIKMIVVIFYISMKVMDVVMEKGEALYRTTVIRGSLTTKKISRMINLMMTAFGNLIIMIMIAK